jgi:hypothetical protein
MSECGVAQCGRLYPIPVRRSPKPTSGGHGCWPPRGALRGCGRQILAHGALHPGWRDVGYFLRVRILARPRAGGAFRGRGQNGPAGFCRRGRRPDPKRGEQRTFTAEGSYLSDKGLMRSENAQPQNRGVHCGGLGWLEHVDWRSPCDAADRFAASQQANQRYRSVCSQSARPLVARWRPASLGAMGLASPLERREARREGSR